MSCRIEYNSSGRCVILANVTCIRFQKCTTLAIGSVAMEHPGPKRATKVRCSVRCSIKPLIAYASEHYKESRRKSIETFTMHINTSSNSSTLSSESKMVDRRIDCGLTKHASAKRQNLAAGSHVMES